MCVLLESVSDVKRFQETHSQNTQQKEIHMWVLWQDVSIIGQF